VHSGTVRRVGSRPCQCWGRCSCCSCSAEGPSCVRSHCCVHTGRLPLCGEPTTRKQGNKTSACQLLLGCGVQCFMQTAAQQEGRLGCWLPTRGWVRTAGSCDRLAGFFTHSHDCSAWGTAGPATIHNNSSMAGRECCQHCSSSCDSPTGTTDNSCQASATMQPSGCAATWEAFSGALGPAGAVLLSQPFCHCGPPPS
jgi:hypothetical protein